MSISLQSEFHAPSAVVVARRELSLQHLFLDSERVLAMLRCRGYELVRLKLSAPGACELLVRLPQVDAGMLDARLRRIEGVTLMPGSAP